MHIITHTHRQTNTHIQAHTLEGFLVLVYLMDTQFMPETVTQSLTQAGSTDRQLDTIAAGICLFSYIANYIDLPLEELAVAFLLRCL